MKVLIYPEGFNKIEFKSPSGLIATAKRKLKEVSVAVKNETFLGEIRPLEKEKRSTFHSITKHFGPSECSVESKESNSTFNMRHEGAFSGTRYNIECITPKGRIWGYRKDELSDAYVLKDNDDRILEIGGDHVDPPYGGGLIIGESAYEYGNSNFDLHSKENEDMIVFMSMFEICFYPFRKSTS